MSDWRPASGPEVARRKAAMLRRIRHYFATQGVLEVDTPALSRSAVSDVQIESLEVRSGQCPGPLYLHTSPEFMMKRMLADSWPDIYSISRVFRDDEWGPRHQPEFTLLEWYRLDFDLGDIVDDAVRLIATALDAPKLADSATVVDYRDAFLSVLALDPASASIRDMSAAANADADLVAAIGTERDDWLDLMMSTRIAPQFAKDCLTVVRHYPASQAALARTCPVDASVADRFEVFIGDMELGNGYVELTDAEEQSARMAADQASRERRGRPVRPRDQALIDALRHGLPECAGVAVGIERLQMIYEKTNDIRNVIPFLFERK